MTDRPCVTASNVVAPDGRRLGDVAFPQFARGTAVTARQLGAEIDAGRFVAGTRRPDGVVVPHAPTGVSLAESLLAEQDSDDDGDGDLFSCLHGLR